MSKFASKCEEGEGRLPRLAALWRAGEHRIAGIAAQTAPTGAPETLAGNVLCTVGEAVAEALSPQGGGSIGEKKRQEQQQGSAKRVRSVSTHGRHTRRERRRRCLFESLPTTESRCAHLCASCHVNSSIISKSACTRIEQSRAAEAALATVVHFDLKYRYSRTPTSADPTHRPRHHATTSAVHQLALHAHSSGSHFCTHTSSHCCRATVDLREHCCR